MSEKRLDLDEATVTLDELVGEMPNWRHYLVASCTVRLCGGTPSGRRPIRFGEPGYGDPSRPMCPDCLRAYRRDPNGWRYR